MPDTAVFAVLDALPAAVVVSRNGATLFCNAAAKRSQAEQPDLLALACAAATDGAGLVEYGGQAYALAHQRWRDGASVVVVLAAPVPGPAARRTAVHDAVAEEHALADDFRDIIRNSFDGIFVADGEGRTQIVNPGCERNYDLSAGDMVGTHVSAFQAGGFITPVIAPEVIASRRPVTAIQRTHKGKTIMVTGIPLFDEAGRVRRVVINSRDMTEMTRLQVELALVQSRLAHAETEVAHLREDGARLDGLVLVSAPMRALAALALRVAKVDTTVLLAGESGVGKEVLARFIHANSPRARGPFIKINCGAIPRELIESELFGYEAGAFTGAQKRGKPGLVELAQHGTLFLDEVGELPLDMQVKLLHVLEDRTVSRVGGTRTVGIDVRVLAATNRDLRRMVGEKTFRADLFYRLNVVPITIPPLRERRDDIVPLAEQSLADFNARYGMRRILSAPLLTHLVAQDWPGNVRELRNLVERLVVTASNDRLDLPEADLDDGNGPIDEGDGTEAGYEVRVDAYARRLVADAVKRYGSTRAAARHLGISQSSVVRKLRGAGHEA